MEEETPRASADSAAGALSALAALVVLPAVTTVLLYQRPVAMLATFRAVSIAGLAGSATSIIPARTWLEASWRAFQGEPVEEDVPSERRPVGRPRKEARGARGRKRGQTVTREMVKTS